MRILTAVAFAVVIVLGAGPASADERADLVKLIVDTQLVDNQPMINEGVSQMAQAMGADRAGLTAEERTRLDSGLRQTLTDIVRDLVMPVLNDPAKFSVEELRAVAAFNASPAGRKWTTLAGAADVTSPEAKTKILTSLLRNVEPSLLAKLFAASQPAPGARTQR